MSEIDEYQKMIDAKTKPGMKIDLISDQISTTVKSWACSKTEVELLPSENSRFENKPETLNHERWFILKNPSDVFPLNGEFGGMSDTEKTNYVSDLFSAKYLDKITALRDPSGFYFWGSGEESLLYYGGSIILEKFDDKESHLPSLPAKCKTVNDLPVVWVGPIITVVPLSILKQQNPDFLFDDDDVKVIVFGGANDPLLNATIDLTGRYGEPGGVLLCKVNPNFITEDGKIKIILRRVSDGEGKFYEMEVRPAKGYTFWGNRTADGKTHNYHDSVKPFMVLEEDRKAGGFWFFPRLIDGSTNLDNLEEQLMEQLPLKVNGLGLTAKETLFEITNYVRQDNTFALEVIFSDFLLGYYDANVNVMDSYLLVSSNFVLGDKSMSIRLNLDMSFEADSSNTDLDI